MPFSWCPKLWLRILVWTLKMRLLLSRYMSVQYMHHLFLSLFLFKLFLLVYSGRAPQGWHCRNKPPNWRDPWSSNGGYLWQLLCQAPTLKLEVHKIISSFWVCPFLSPYLSSLGAAPLPPLWLTYCINVHVKRYFCQTSPKWLNYKKPDEVLSGLNFLHF